MTNAKAIIIAGVLIATAITLDSCQSNFRSVKQEQLCIDALYTLAERDRVPGSKIEANFILQCNGVR